MSANERSTLMPASEYRLMFEVERTHWWYRALRAWLRRALESHLPSGAHVLDSGCGTGANLALLREMGYDAAGHDPSADALALTAQRPELATQLCRASADLLPYPDAQFDGVVSMDVLYLLPADQERAALREFYRVLRPGGVLLLNLPAFDWLSGEHDQAIAARRRYDAPMLRARLEQAGFTARRLEYRCMLPLPAVYLARRFLRRAKPEGQEARSDLSVGLSAFNGILSMIERAEEAAGTIIPRPFGTSLAAIATR